MCVLACAQLQSVILMDTIKPCKSPRSIEVNITGLAVLKYPDSDMLSLELQSLLICLFSVPRLNEKSYLFLAFISFCERSDKSEATDYC